MRRQTVHRPPAKVSAPPTTTLAIGLALGESGLGFHFEDANLTMNLGSVALRSSSPKVP